MFDELSRIYTEVAERTIAELPPDWKAFWIREECSEGSWSPSSWYEVRDVEEITHFEAPDEATDLIHDAWKISRAHNDRWSSVVFHVIAPGELHITFGRENYDDEECDGSGDRMDAFEEKTFPGRKVVSIVYMSGAFSLTPEMLKSGVFGRDA